MKALILVLLFFMAGCAQQPVPEFYVPQQTLSDCGKASAAMLVNFAGGKSSVAEAARLTR